MAKVRPGDKFVPRATFLNKLDDLVNAPGGDRQQLLTGNNTPTIVMVKNTHSSFVEANGILGIDTSIINPTDSEEQLLFRSNKPSFNGVEPVPGTHEGRICILTQGLDTNEVGPAILTGFAAVQIDIIDVGHRYATIAQESANDPTEKLESVPAGPIIILFPDPASSTGTTWCLVQLGGARQLPLLWEATSSASGNTIEGKQVNSDDSLEGDAMEFWAMD